MSTPPIVELDVRPLFAQQRAPLPAILSAVNGLVPGQAFRLIAPFEPRPLYEMLGGRGYRAKPAQRPNGDWEILFEPVS